MNNFDCIVLGLGGVGSAAIYQLAERGLRCLGLEQFAAVHNRGSSHGHSRIIRKAYFEHPDYVPLLYRAYELWSELEAVSSRRLFHRIGLAQFGPADGVIIRGIEASASEHHLAIDRLTPAEFQREHPDFSLPQEMTVLVERDAGILLVEQCVKTHLELAGHSGAELLFECPVREVRPTNDAVELVTDDATYSTACLIITAGAWAEPLLGLPVNLRVVRKHMHWFDCGAALRSPATPAFFFQMPNGYFYGVPAMANLGVKIAEHSSGEDIVDPAAVSRDVDPQDLGRVEQFAKTTFPNASKRRARHEVCLYTVSPDEHFIVDRHPKHPHIAFAAALSGHGFKFAPALAEQLVSSVIDGSFSKSAKFLSCARFG